MALLTFVRCLQACQAFKLVYQLVNVVKLIKKNQEFGIFRQNGSSITLIDYMVY